MVFKLVEPRMPEETVEGWAIYCDMPMTRRKHFHVVTDARGAPRFKSRSFTECAAFLADNGVSAYKLMWFTNQTLPPVMVTGGIARN
jgi:hypothetical protein